MNREAIGMYVVLVVGIGLVAAVVFGLWLLKDDEGSYRIDVETQAIRVALAQYKTEFGAFPSGDSRAVCLALAGQNAKKMAFIELPSVSREGEFLDPWGTPYRIYFSDNWPMIRSAGPNKQFDSSTARKASDDYFGG